MALIPFVPFTSGAVFTPEIANAIAVPVFDDQVQYFGHLARIKDTDLDTGVNSLMARVGTLGLNLKVSAGSGLNANFAAGRLLYGTTLFTLGASSITLVASSVNYIYGTLSGTIVASVAQPPIVRALLATVTTNTTGVIGVVDYREGVSVEVVKPYTLSIRNFGGRGDDGDFVAVGGEVLADGEYYFNNFTVGLGKIIYITQLARIFCSGDFNILGTVVVSAATPGAAPYTVAGAKFFNGLTGTGFGGSTTEDPGSTYSYVLSPVGSGGGGGAVSTNNTAGKYYTTAGGFGGGGLLLEVAGRVNISGAITANGDAGQNAQQSPDGSAVGDYVGIGGAGGGSGGLILIKSLVSIVIGGLVSANGGKGGDSVPTGTPDRSTEPGAGGGGGRIVLFSPSINTTGSVLAVTGGANGSNVGSFPNAPVYGAGAAGGSYGGMGGDQLPISGTQSLATVGVITIKNRVPVG